MHVHTGFLNSTDVTVARENVVTRISNGDVGNTWTIAPWYRNQLDFVFWATRYQGE